MNLIHTKAQLSPLAVQALRNTDAALTDHENRLTAQQRIHLDVSLPNDENKAVLAQLTDNIETRAHHDVQLLALLRQTKLMLPLLKALW